MTKTEQSDCKPKRLLCSRVYFCYFVSECASMSTHHADLDEVMTTKEAAKLFRFDGGWFINETWYPDHRVHSVGFHYYEDHFV